MAVVFLVSLLQLNSAQVTVPLYLTQTESSIRLNQLYSDGIPFDLHSIYSSQYYLTLYLGTPLRQVHLQIDSMTGWTWLPSVDCVCHDSIHFNTSESSSFLSLNQDLEVNFTFGAVSGTIGQESFTISQGVNLNSSFLVVDKENDLWWGKEKLWWMATDGFFGLGFVGTQYFSILDNLQNEGILENRVFGLYFSRDESFEQSQLTLGGSNTTYTDPTIISIEDTGFWQASASLVAVNNEVFNDTFEVIFDIGNSFIIGPPHVIEEIWRQIDLFSTCRIESEIFLICEKSEANITDFPELYFEIQNNSYIIYPEDYTYFSGNDIYILLIPHNLSHFLLGHPFFKEYYSVFDMDNSEVRLFKIKPSDTTSLFLYLIVAVLVLLIITIPILVYCLISHRKKQSILQLDPNEDPLFTPLIKSSNEN